MVKIYFSNYLARKPIEDAMRDFGKRFTKDQKVLDIGCGNKPYANFFQCEYIGLDPFPGTKADIVAEAWEIPCDDKSFDGVILNQSLEHIKNLEGTIQELHRVLKLGGIAIITVPQTMKNHSIALPSQKAPYNNFNTEEIPYWHNDFYRFTKFGLIHLFRNFKIITLKETNGYLSTLLQLLNYFFASLHIPFIFYPVYLLNNILGLALDKAIHILCSNVRVSQVEKFNVLIYKSLTLNYILIIKKI